MLWLMQVTRQQPIILVSRLQQTVPTSTGHDDGCCPDEGMILNASRSAESQSTNQKASWGQLILMWPLVGLLFLGGFSYISLV